LVIAAVSAGEWIAEKDLGRPVLTGSQVAFWYALRMAGVGAEVNNYGQVFRKNLK
jgi:maleate cis-trans isomerase